MKKSPTELYLIERICSVCHAGILESHPDEYLRDKGYIKCPICGFAKDISKPIPQHEKVVYGK